MGLLLSELQLSTASDENLRGRQPLATTAAASAATSLVLTRLPSRFPATAGSKTMFLAMDAAVSVLAQAEQLVAQVGSG